ncbi:MAG TPA: 1,4-alpha-glucan branching protein GlgB, partial [Gemmatimonadaceae bacterium]|nr:1,4-alpha-glucan branching protein GlgB [Gemmatimonadaceae bacterium]
AMNGPMSIYEVHLGSWARVPEEGNRSLTYREIAPLLADYVTRMGFTHVELMPVMEHPFYGSWGYQVCGYFATTSRYGTPQDLMYLIDTLHQRGIGVLLDWVPSHFPTDAHGLSYFDGTHLYEHEDPRKGHQPDWGSYIFNYGRYEVQNFLRSNAVFWLEMFHADGLRVDAVASMLYLDFSRKEGEWLPNQYGGRENLEAIHFLQRLNESVYREHPDTETIAEDSTAWPMVTKPAYIGGLGFGLKWDMGWMHDTLDYFAKDPIHRSYHHNKITFRMMYAFSENYVLPISHDEVVHGKGSLINKMAGDNWQKRANLRLLLGYQWAQSGKKFLFMGCEIGQYREWNHDASIDWHLLQFAEHRGIQQWVADLNALYRDEPAMHELDNDPAGFEWVDCNDAEQSIVSFLRFNKDKSRAILCVCNFTPVPRVAHKVGVPESLRWDEVLNSDAEGYGGAGWGNLGGVFTEPQSVHGRERSVTLTLPPLSISFFRMVPLPSAAIDFEEAPGALPDTEGVDVLDAAIVAPDESLSTADVLESLGRVSVSDALDALESGEPADAALVTPDEVERAVERAVEAPLMDTAAPHEALAFVPEAEVVRTETEVSTPVPKPAKRPAAKRSAKGKAPAAPAKSPTEKSTEKPAAQPSEPPAARKGAQAKAKTKAQTGPTASGDAPPPPNPSRRKKR